MCAQIFHMVNIDVPAGVGAPPLDTTSFWYCHLGMVREKKGGRGGQGEDACSTFLFT